MAFQRKMSKDTLRAKRAIARNKEAGRKYEERQREAFAKVVADPENMSEMAWSGPGTSWECEADNTNGSHIYEVLENVITSVEQYYYYRRITFRLDNDKLYQFTPRMGHDGDHEWGEPYEVEISHQEQVTRYKRK